MEERELPISSVEFKAISLSLNFQLNAKRPSAYVDKIQQEFLKFIEERSVKSKILLAEGLKLIELSRGKRICDGLATTSRTQRKPSFLRKLTMKLSASRFTLCQWLEHENVLPHKAVTLIKTPM